MVVVEAVLNSYYFPCPSPSATTRVVRRLGLGCWAWGWVPKGSV